MKNSRGMTLIEVIIFIIVIGIVSAGALTVFTTVLMNSNRPSYLIKANLLASARMNLIIQRRIVEGFASISDPCSSGSLPVCTSLNTTGYTVNSSFTPDADGGTTARVIVSGIGDSTLTMRFVQ